MVFYRNMYWTCAVNNNKKSVDVLYIDMAKAFETISYENLVFKLSLLGFGGKVIVWIRNFFRNRTKRVRVGSVMSRPASVVTVNSAEDCLKINVDVCSIEQLMDAGQIKVNVN